MTGMKRFTLRDLFWLILVVAIIAAWWVDRGKSHEEYRELEQKYRSASHSAGTFLDILQDDGYKVEWRFGIAIQAPDGHFALQWDKFFGLEDIKANTRAYAPEEQ